ncbi:MAG TPA: M67 family metallopeptidase [Rhizomicrobium sp.]
MIEKLYFPTPLWDGLADEARAAFPRECCGLIEGIRDKTAAHAVAIHATRNAALEADRFEIDPAEHIRLLGQLRGTAKEIIGCYHSHPNGLAEPSKHDLAGASREDFLWLIVALATCKGRLDVQLGAFDIGPGRVREVAIESDTIAAA